MKVSEMIEWLKTQDQDAIVQIVCHTSGTGYYDQGGNATIIDFTDEFLYGCPQSGKTFEYTDFRNNQFVKPEAPHYQKTYLLLGVHNG